MSDVMWPGFEAYLYFLTVIEWFGYVVLGGIGLLILIDFCSAPSRRALEKLKRIYSKE